MDRPGTLTITEYLQTMGRDKAVTLYRRHCLTLTEAKECDETKWAQWARLARPSRFIVIEWQEMSELL